MTEWLPKSLSVWISLSMLCIAPFAAILYLTEDLFFEDGEARAARLSACSYWRFESGVDVTYITFPDGELPPVVTKSTQIAEKHGQFGFEIPIAQAEFALNHDSIPIFADGKLTKPNYAGDGRFVLTLVEVPVESSPEVKKVIERFAQLEQNGATRSMKSPWGNIELGRGGPCHANVVLFRNARQNFADYANIIARRQVIDGLQLPLSKQPHEFDKYVEKLFRIDGVGTPILREDRRMELGDIFRRFLENRRNPQPSDPKWPEKDLLFWERHVNPGLPVGTYFSRAAKIFLESNQKYVEFSSVSQIVDLTKIPEHLPLDPPYFP